MQAALPKLTRRLDELRKFDAGSITRVDDPHVTALEHKYKSTLSEIYGIDSVEYGSYFIDSFYFGSFSMGEEPSSHEILEGYEQGLAQAISNLEAMIDLMKENLADLDESPQGRVTRAFESLKIHPDIERNVGKLVRDGHYANAVEDACKVLDGLVKVRSGRFDLGGTDLMTTVFGSKSPKLRFNSLESDSDRSEQQGMMHLYAGAMLALRNPRAHGIIRDDPEQALEYIGFLSLLAKALQRTERV